MDGIKFRNNQTILLGDTHSYATTNILIKQTDGLEFHDLIHLGDGGEGFSGHKEDEFWLNTINESCKKKDIQLYIIRGNHSNPDVWNRGYKFSNLQLVKDYTSGYFPNGKSALFVGGGVSIDRCYRILNKSYWKDEITPYKKIDKKYNILFAHDAPDYFNHSTLSLKHSPWSGLLEKDPTLFKDSLNQRNVISRIVEDIKPELAFSGHFHNFIEEERNGIKYRCLNINEMALIRV